MNTARAPIATASPRTLLALVGVPAAAILVAYVPQFEGTVTRGYRDPVGIITACTGHTGEGAELGRTYTAAECQQFLQVDLYEHAEDVLACVPDLKDKPGPLAATTSFAFNVGGAKFCSSTMARKFAAGDIAGGCAEFSRWTLAGGKQLPGLVTRRRIERAICEGRQA